MRIGLFTDTYPPFINGVSTSVNMLKNALEKLGHEVFVVTVNTEGYEYNIKEDGKVICVPGVPIKLFDYRISSIYPMKIVKTIKSWQLDVIHSHTEFGIGTYARIMAKKLKIPVIHTYHTMYEDYVYYITKGHFDKLSKRVVKHLTKFYCDKTAKELIVPTIKTKEFLIEKYNCNSNIHVIPTGIETERFYEENVDKTKVSKVEQDLGLKKDDFKIIFVGRLGKEKNIEFLIEAQQLLNKKDNKIKLLIVGAGPYLDILKEKAQELNVLDSIIFVGKVAWENMPIYYQVADVFATASRSETQGLTVIEAMAAAKIPVCINDESFKKTVKDGKNGIIFDDLEDYCAKIKELLKNKDKPSFKVLQKQAREDSYLYSALNYAKSCLKVYDKAIKEYPIVKYRKRDKRKDSN